MVSTAGGCNAAVAAGRAVVKEIRDQQLQQAAADVGRCVDRPMPSVIKQLLGFSTKQLCQLAVLAQV